MSKVEQSRPLPLREGFTTGTAAAAAAAAATHLLLEQSYLREVFVSLPPFNEQACRLCIPIEDHRFEQITKEVKNGTKSENGSGGDSKGESGGGENIEAICSVIKDGGDDPDATSGLAIVAKVRKTEGQRGEGGVILKGGKGIGIVTLPGLSLSVGEVAINPVPRRQITLAVKEAASACQYKGGLEVTISVPRGEEAAKKTLNRKLGIVGGISILGTGGTVRPFSHKAWANTIAQNIKVIKAQNLAFAGLCTGRRSEELLKQLYASAPDFVFMQVADFMGFAVKESAQRGLNHIAVGCFFGKLLKIAAGMEYTHAHSAAIDFLPLAQICQRHGLALNGVRGVAAANTAQEALGIIKTFGPDMQNSILQEVKQKAKEVLAFWAKEAAKEARGEEMNIELHLFEL